MSYHKNLLNFYGNYKMDNIIKNPITHQYMHIFTDEFISLLKMGYTVEDLLNLPRIESAPSLTGIDDLDYKIMSHLSINDLRSLSYINNYTYDQLHKDEFLWINKLKEEGLYQSIPDNIDLNTINWLRLYKTLKNVKEDIHNIGEYESIKYRISDIKHFDKLALDLNIPVKMHLRYPEFKIIIRSEGYYIKTQASEFTPISTKQLSDLLFDLYYNNVIIKVKK